MMSSQYSYASVRFLTGWNNKTYLFRLYDQVEVGDYVVVDTMYGLQVAKVEDITTESDFEPTKDVVCMLDMRNFLRRQRDRKVEEINNEIKLLQEKLKSLYAEED